MRTPALASARRQWARREAVEWEDPLDILEANGAFCDCEVVLNLPETATPIKKLVWPGHR
jgi:hypothetical protein